MAIFGIIVKENDIVEDVLNKVKDKLLSSNFISNPFIGGVSQFIPKPIKDDIKQGYIIRIEPIYPNFPFLCLCAALGIWYVFDFNWIVAVLCFMGLFSVLWSKYFYYGILLLKLKKSGFKGKVELLNSNDIIKQIVF